MKIQLKDFTVHYEEQGTGQPLVLLHGNGEDLSYFKNQMAYFSSLYRVIALDTRGHGGSSRGKAPFTLQQFAKDLYEFLRAMQLGPVYLLGFSDGGNTAIAFAKEHPRLVKKLILNGANLRPEGMNLSVLASVWTQYQAWRLLAPFGAGFRARKELFGLMVNQPHYGPKDLEALTMPVLVIAGNRDMIRESHTREIARGIKGSRLVILKGGHFVARENPQAFNRAVEGFLKNDRQK